jgi:hypothetical protein
MKGFLSAVQAAAKLEISTGYLYKLVARGEVQGEHIGRALVVREESVEARRQTLTTARGQQK